MVQNSLSDSVMALAKLAYPLTEAELEQPWQWQYHAEGIRFGFIGSYHELRDLGSHLYNARLASGTPLTRAQQLLGHYHNAYRDFQAMLLGVPADLIDQKPASGEWTIREIVAHVVYVKCSFFTLIYDGLVWSREGGKRPSFSQDRVAALIDGYAELETTINQPDLVPLLAFFDRFHQRLLTEFATINDEELDILSPWWESEPVSLAWRLHRFDAHLREHTIQLEKTLPLLDHPFTEGKRQARQLFHALADMEKMMIGAGELEQERLTALTQTFNSRADELTSVLKQVAEIQTAVSTNNLPLVQQIIRTNPAMVDAKDSKRLPITLAAAYRRQQGMIDYLIEAGAYLDLFTATAVGQLNRVQEQIKSGYWQVNQINIDGFAPLQLAAFFGHEAIATWLIAQGADVNAASENGQRIRPVHAASAAGSIPILQALLEAGADVNAQQAGGFTPLHAAVQSNNLEMAQLLLDFGADPAIAADDGQTAVEIAQAAGYEALASTIRSEAKK